MPRSLHHLIQALDIQRGVPSRRMLPTGQRSLAELRDSWEGHPRWLRAFAEASDEGALGQAFFTHPVAGPITLAQALRMDLLHLRTHCRQIAKRRPRHLRQPA